MPDAYWWHWLKLILSEIDNLLCDENVMSTEKAVPILRRILRLSRQLIESSRFHLIWPLIDWLKILYSHKFGHILVIFWLDFTIDFSWSSSETWYSSHHEMHQSSLYHFLSFSIMLDDNEWYLAQCVIVISSLVSSSSLQYAGDNVLNRYNLWLRFVINLLRICSHYALHNVTAGPTSAFHIASLLWGVFTQ